MNRVKLHKLLDAVLDLFEEETTTDVNIDIDKPIDAKRVADIVTKTIKDAQRRASGSEAKPSPYILHLTLGTIYKIVEEDKDTYDVEYFDGEVKKFKTMLKDAVNDLVLTHLTESESRQILPIERSSRPFLINKLRNW